MAELQTIPARHGVATFVPAGQVIKIVNTSGTQVVDTWAFALPKPEEKKIGGDADEQETKVENEDVSKADAAPTANIKKKKTSELPSQEEAEKATRDAQAEGGQDATQKKSTWSSYVPSVPSLGLGKKTDQEADTGNKDETEQQKNSRTWGSYFTAGKGISSYIPKQATDTVSQFTSYHERDRNKTYMQQLQDFSQTPVGAAGWKGMAAMTGSGYSGSLYAGYQAWNAKNAANVRQMEYMSMGHSRVTTLHLRPHVNDTLVTNIREPILTIIEDSSSGIHDTLIPACDPYRYKSLNVPKWEEHGSCAENLVLALKELNERAGLKGAKAVGADVTINNVPAPLNLWMNIPWDDDGDIAFKGPKSKAGDYIRLRAERDVVVVMSACPNDVNGINGQKITDANFVLEEGEDTTAAIKRTAPKKKAPPRRVSSSQAPSSTTSAPVKKPAPPKTALPKKAPPAAPGQATSGQKTYTPAAKKPAPQLVKQAPQPAQAAAKPPAQAPAKSVKKPIPPPVKPSTNGDAATVEKKKPRKIVRPQAAASAES